ncbi:MAG: polysaccharide biosynthesis C-terminal domain-containing protein [Alphaproteobacteria bacterium]|nr:polysaccharide biosynthesis C-terminal domain-containing protein [Alphaproteobacteria bacterium]
MLDRIVGTVRRHRHMNWALMDQGMVSGVNFLTTILIARHLGIEEFGRFTLAWLVVLFVTSLQMAVIVSPMMSVGPKQEPAEAPAYYGALFLQQLIFAGLTFLLILLGAYGVAALRPEWDLRALAVPLAATAVLFQLRDFLRRYFFTRERPVMAFISDVIGYLGLLVALALLLPFFTFDSATVLWLIGAASATAILISAPFLGRLAWQLRAFLTISVRHWQFAKWMGASALLQWASTNLFLIVSGGLLGPAAVGALRAAETLIGINRIFFQGLENVVPLHAVRRLTEEGPPALGGYLRRIGVAGGLATAGVGAIAALAPGFWLELFFGETYAEHGALVYWYAVIYLVMFIGLPLRAGLRALENTKPIFQATAVSAVFSLAAAMPLIDALGATGAVAGLLVTNLLLIGVLAVHLRREMGRHDV